MAIARDEICGPVVSVIPYESEAEAVAIANDSSYGLAGSVWTDDPERGLTIARRARVGTFGVNLYVPDLGAPWGGRKKVVGTNPWSWACPAGSYGSMALDIANTGVARGKVYLARQRGQEIPLGWAINAAGAPTTDPAEAIEGIILPMAQHKGYAIALMMDMLSGVLTGSGYGDAVAGPYQAERRSHAGHLMIALNIEAMQPLVEFSARMEALIGQIKSVPLAQGFDEVFYPGEIEARNDARNRQQGLSLPEDTLTDLRKIAGQYGLERLLPF